MREIKFQGYSVEKLVSGSQWITDGYGVFTIKYVDGKEETYLETEHGNYRVYKKSVGQYIGLKDHNGNYIFEGHLVKGINRLHESETMERVTFLNGCYMFGNWNAHEFFNRHTHIEVVGNIYEDGDERDKRIEEAFKRVVKRNGPGLKRLSEN